MQDKPAKTRFSLLGLFIILVVFVVLVGVLLPARQHTGPGGPSRPLRDGAQLKQIHLSITTYLQNEDTTVPPTWAILNHIGSVVPELFCSYRGYIEGKPEDALKIGEISYAEMGKDDVTEEMIFQQASAELRDQPWEQLGEVMVSRELELLRSYRSELVAVFFLVPSVKQGWQHPASVYFAFADNHVSAVPMRLKGEQTPQYLEMIAADRTARAELGLSPPPDYAALIREYVAEMEGE